ncbi:uncharacterized protein N7458_012480 [Penicillium daleae]|uniref:GP-PDE domain-containing protein n=1 Tax=Penicillium daleae TaxID=63821 RepID=A0AAD6BV16_9EURO|nr:uncharacterized protein N7458_012480 [Penicillium daleae]KAJ5433324.1 hypothetical protein N7458_012480 [Penicillium daleae]
MITRVGEEDVFHDHLEQIQNRQSLCEICRGGTRENTVGLAVDILCLDQKNVLAVDKLGRLPLHYSALCGLDTVCQKILSHVQDQGQASSLILSLDAQGYTPFHYAVAENHVAVAKIFLDTLKVEGRLSGQPSFKIMSHMQSLLNIAIRGSAHEESPVYVAAEIGRDDYLKILLEIGKKTNIDDPQLPYGWSALTIACIKGHRKAAELLVQAGASQRIPDYRGWYAIEHVVLRGHFSLAELLKSWDKSQMTGNPVIMSLPPVHHAGSDLSVTSDHAIVNIGVLQNGKQVKGVELKNISSKDKILTGLSPPLDMSVSVGSTVSHLVHLPILSDMANEPFIFPIHNPNEAHLVFKFYRQGSSCGKGDLIGSAATLLRSEEDYFGPTRESLFRGHTIPILAKETSEILGTVTFTFLIAKQPMDLKTSPPIDNYFPERGTQLVGHRDVQLTRDFVPVIFHDFSLSESGTDVPIHDLTFEQVGILRMTRVLKAHYGSLCTQANSNFPENIHIGDMETVVQSAAQNTRQRSRSLTTTYIQEIHPVLERMRYTVDLKNKGFKPNTRGSFIQGPFTTLRELLVKLPDSINFNVEISMSLSVQYLFFQSCGLNLPEEEYPRLHEAIEAGLAPVALEINEFVDRILDQIFQNARGRKIILSSFTPEICILLAIKQKRYPVMFITNAGKLPASDLEMRACSLQAAVRCSKRWNLAGIVFASDILLLCPRLVGYVRQSGFVCGSYSSLNNVPENVRVQQAAGVQILMADRVGVVSTVLNESHMDPFVNVSTRLTRHM